MNPKKGITDACTCWTGSPKGRATVGAGVADGSNLRLRAPRCLTSLGRGPCQGWTARATPEPNSGQSYVLADWSRSLSPDVPVETRRVVLRPPTVKDMALAFQSLEEDPHLTGRAGRAATLACVVRLFCRPPPGVREAPDRGNWVVELTVLQRRHARRTRPPWVRRSTRKVA